jgi:hypothetical protein
MVRSRPRSRPRRRTTPGTGHNHAWWHPIRPFGRPKLDDFRSTASERGSPFTTADFAPNNEPAPAAAGLDPARQQGTGDPGDSGWLGRRSITSPAVSRYVTCAPHPSDVAAVRALVRIGHRREPIRWPAIGHMTHPQLRTASPLTADLWIGFAGRQHGPFNTTGFGHRR